MYQPFLLSVLLSVFSSSYYEFCLLSFDRKCLQTSDARVSKTSEILGGIRALRQMGWEDIFDARVRKLRDEARPGATEGGKRRGERRGLSPEPPNKKRHWGWVETI